MRRPQLSYANVVATLALFVALGGGAYAVGGDLGKDSVKPKHLSQPLAAKLADATSVGGRITPPLSDDPCEILDPNDPSEEGCTNTPFATKSFAFLATKTWLLNCPPGKFPAGIPYPLVSVTTGADHFTGEGTFNGLQVIFTLTNWTKGKQKFTPWMPCGDD